MVAVLLLLLAALPAAAQQRDTTRADTTVYRVGEIRVRTARPVATTGGASALEVRLDSMRLPPSPTLAEVLRQVPMVRVRTNSRGEAEITVRGSESRQVAVLLDGVPLTLAWDARTDASVIPVAAAQELTFVRGLSSVLHGPNTLGGIIEVGVARGTAPLPPGSVEVTAGADHVGGWGTTAAVTSPFQLERGSLLVRGGAGWRSSPGMPLAAGVTEPVATGDELRLNTDSEQFDGFVAIRYNEDGGTWLSFSGSGFSAERGVAAELGASQPRLWRYPSVSRVIGVVSGGTGQRDTPFGGRGDLEASIGLDRGRTEVDAYATRAYRDVIGSETGDDRTVTLRLLGDHSLGERGELRGAFTFAGIDRDETVDGETATYRQRLWSAGLETVWRVAGGVRLSAGGVADGADTPETGGRPSQPGLDDWGGRLGATAPLAGGRAIAHAGVSRRARFPALRELYSGALGRFEPNPGLRPERMIAAEAGVTARLGDGELQVVGFHHRLDHAVVRTVTLEGRFRRENRDRLASTGVEVALSGAIGPVGLAGDLLWQSVRLTDTTAGTTNRPENLPSLFGGVTARASLPAGIAASAAARYTGDQYCVDPDTGGDRALAGATLVDLDLRRTWHVRSGGIFSQLDAGAVIENAGDLALYDQCGLPRQGRLLRVQVRLR